MLQASLRLSPAGVPSPGPMSVPLVDQHSSQYLETQKSTASDLSLCEQQEMGTHSSILACKIPWTEEPGRLQSMGSQSQPGLNMHTRHCVITPEPPDLRLGYLLSGPWRDTARGLASTFPQVSLSSLADGLLVTYL